MYSTIKRIINWSDNLKGNLYKSFVYSILNSIFMAIPIIIAAYGLNIVISDFYNKSDIVMRDIWIITILMILAVFFRFITAYYRAIFQDSIGYEIAAKKRNELGNILRNVSLGFFSENKIGKIVAAVTTDISFLEMFTMKMIDTVINGYIYIIVCCLSMMIFNFYIGCIVIIGVLFSALFLKLMSNKSKKNAPIYQKAKEDSISNTIEYLRGISVVKSFNQEGVSIDGIKNSYKKSCDTNIKIEKEYVPYNCMHLLSLKIASVAIIFLASYYGMSKEMNMATMIMMIIFSFVIFGHIEALNNATHVLEIIDEAMDKIEEIEKVKPIDVNSKDLNINSYNIAFNNVSFGYGKRTIIKDISFEIQENTTTAIVGPSGSGKSTICNLIARFYDVDNGSITIGGINIKDVKCDKILSAISMVFQKVYLFQDTILNNIKFGKPDATFEEIVEISKKARCHDFIMKLPDGYNTTIGDCGATLSGGEKQRISIARAMLKDAPIVILDEATASIDPENEQVIQEAIGELVKDKTVIIIAHRLATIENVDKILVVDDGKIVQEGNHKDLIQENGIYREFLKRRELAEGWSI